VGRRYVRPDVLSRRVLWLLLRWIGLLLLASLALVLLRWWLLALWLLELLPLYFFELLLRWWLLEPRRGWSCWRPLR